MELTGIVVKGLGEGGRYVEKYNPYFQEKLGFRAFPGTLNIRVRNPPSLKNPLLITPKEKGLFPVECFPAIINQEVKGALLRPGRTSHPPGILEIIAPINLKERFSLREGDEVEVTV